MTSETDDVKLPSSLNWLMDAPMFIDEQRVAQFYDAIVRPVHKEGAKKLQISSSKAKEIRGKLGVEAGVSPSKLLGALISSVADVEIKATGEVEGGTATENAQSFEVTLEPISSPERQLEQLAVHYLIRHTGRLFFDFDATEKLWRSREAISEAPRALVFLNLPGQDEAESLNLPETRLIPTAAEFESGEIVLLYSQLGRNDWTPPKYPERADSVEELRHQRKEYWLEFGEKFQATKAMQVVEEACKDKGKISWIDYRLPLTLDGDTLHLHICPSGSYDTGTFAYNFIKRGQKHGLRLVGTLKSEPDMNVLAIYEK